MPAPRLLPALLALACSSQFTVNPVAPHPGKGDDTGAPDTGSPDTGSPAGDTSAPVVISHHKCSMPENFGRSMQTLPAMDTAALGQTVHFDVYPYPAGSTVMMPDKLRQDVAKWGKIVKEHNIKPD